MTNDNLFIAEVRNILDPWKSGRLQIRIYGHNDDTQNIKDADLLWAMPIQPITSAATGKVGIAPVGAVVGSRVIGMFVDEAKQIPIILGPYSRAAEAGNATDNRGGQSDNKAGSAGVDTPASANPSPPGGSSNLGLAPNHPKLGGTPLNTANDVYNAATVVSNGTGKPAIATAISTYAPNANKPTTASAAPGTDLASILKQVDPNAVAQVLGSMMVMFSLAGATVAATTPSIISYNITDALTGALAILATKYGFQNIIDIFNTCLANNGISLIEPQYQQIVQNALSALITSAATNGETNVSNGLPYTIVPVQTQAIAIVAPQPLYALPLDGYTQQYYPAATDPYPGYIQWQGPNGNYIYTLRDLVANPPYSSAQEAVYTTSSYQIATDLTPYIIAGAITTTQLNAVLDENFEVVSNAGINNCLGSNVALNIMNMLKMILGVLGTVINITNTLQLPNSVLNQGSVNQSLQSFSKNMAIIQQLKTQTAGAFNLPSPLAGLTGNLGSITNSLGALGSTIQTVTSVQNLVNNLTPK